MRPPQHGGSNETLPSPSVSKNPSPLPTKSAWLRGPPLSATVPSPRSQSPALPSAIPIYHTHSRRPSALPIKDGVSVPQSNVGAVQLGQALIGFCDLTYVSLNVIPLLLNSAVTFGSINNDALGTGQAPILHSMRPPQHGGSNGTLPSPSYSSRPIQKGAGPHPQSSGLPPPTPQMQMGWQYYVGYLLFSLFRLLTLSSVP